jgi:hypothetical protein
MMHYHIWIEVTDYYGTRTPRPRKVRYSVKRVVEPCAIIGGRDMSYKPDQETGIRAGCYDAVKDAESRGEMLTADEVEVMLEQVQQYLKRGKIDRVLRSKLIKVSAPAELFDEIKKPTQSV